jgi:hemerythrin
MKYQKIVWGKDLLTGIKLIDSQNREFIGLVNKLLDISAKSDDEQLIIKSFAFLKYYINEHFSVEEAAMFEYDYPAYAIHRNIHTCFREEFERLELSLKNKAHPHDVVTKINYLVVNWFLNHIKTDDMKLSEYLLAKAEEKNEFLVNRLEQIVATFFKAKEDV